MQHSYNYYLLIRLVLRGAPVLPQPCMSFAGSAEACVRPKIRLVILHCMPSECDKNSHASSLHDYHYGHGLGDDA